KDVEIIFDASSMEIFANGGSWTFTTRFYPENHNYKVISNAYLARKINSINVKGE
ncbi:GH32 C-terminal domain-containing protein, partial [Streptococcus danieliae]|nr:GH32 C-terminal domain-containing protein [Streptococcus danieliae]